MNWQSRLSALFSAHRSRLESLAARRVRDREAAADIVQDVFSRVLKAGSCGSVESDTKILFASVRNAAIDYQRSQAKRRTLLAGVLPEQLSGCGLEPAPDAVMEGRETLGLLDRALLELSPKTRDIFILHRVHGMPNIEIARRYGISASAVEKHVARALRHCQARLADRA